jgi:hypothetical protein
MDPTGQTYRADNRRCVNFTRLEPADEKVEALYRTKIFQVGYNKVVSFLSITTSENNNIIKFACFTSISPLSN